MPPVQVAKQQSREDIKDRLGGWCCVAIGLILYCCFFIPISNNLWNSYEESSCFIVNNRVIESQTCWKCQSKPVFYAVWVIDVHRTRSQPTRYLADIRQKFDSYYEAYEAVLTNYVNGTQQRCYVYSSDKFDIRWADSPSHGIISALFGIGTLFFIIIIVSGIPGVLKDERPL